jgi:hypothetical protein
MVGGVYRTLVGILFFPQRDWDIKKKGFSAFFFFFFRLGIMNDEMTSEDV